MGFIRDGKAEVQIWLTEKSRANLAQLKELGFEVVLDAKNPKVIIGRLPVEKLEALAKLKVCEIRRAAAATEFTDHTDPCNLWRMPVVMKFGGTSVADAAAFENVARIVATKRAASPDCRRFGDERSD